MLKTAATTVVFQSVLAKRPTSFVGNHDVNRAQKTRGSRADRGFSVRSEREYPRSATPDSSVLYSLVVCSTSSKAAGRNFRILGIFFDVGGDDFGSARRAILSDDVDAHDVRLLVENFLNAAFDRGRRLGELKQAVADDLSRESRARLLADLADLFFENRTGQLVLGDRDHDEGRNDHAKSTRMILAWRSRCRRSAAL